MTGIQGILLIGVLLIGIYVLVVLGRRLLDLFLLVLMGGSAIAFILWPSLTTIIAHRLGVGRGADMVIYISILIFWFVALKLYIRMRRLERMFTDAIRSSSLEKARRPPGSS